MKRIRTKFLITMMLLLILTVACACGNGDEDESYNSDWQGTLEASQGVQIEGAQDGVVFATYSEEAEIKEFMNSLEIDNWESADIPEDGKKEFIVKFYRQDTINPGENEEDVNGTQTVVGSITTFKGSSVISFESLGLNLGFKIPENAIQNIKNVQ